MLSLVKGLAFRKILKYLAEMRRFNMCVREVIGSQVRSRASFGGIKARATSSILKIPPKGQPSAAGPFFSF